MVLATERRRAPPQNKDHRLCWLAKVLLGALGVLVAPAGIELGASFALGQSLSRQERETAAGLRVEAIREVTVALADKAMEGRGTGQPGGLKAARYLAERFGKLGLKPLGDQGGHLQAFACKPIYRSSESSTAHNVVGLLEGADPRLKAEAVVYSAHYDGLGKRPDGRILPGAADNALGVGKMLALAEALARSSARPRRSVIFLAPTGEEVGFLGSRHWLQHPTWPVAKIAANLNFDGSDTETYGPLKAIYVVGMWHSNVDTTLGETARDLQLLVVPDIAWKQRFFSRSDHYQFALAGVPTAFVFGLGVTPAPTDAKATAGGLLGTLAELQSTAKGLLAVKTRAEQYLANHYHRESDVVRPDWDWGGVRTAAVFYLVAGLRIANADTMPTWLPASTYHRPRGTPPPALRSQPAPGAPKSPVLPSTPKPR